MATTTTAILSNESADVDSQSLVIVTKRADPVNWTTNIPTEGLDTTIGTRDLTWQPWFYKVGLVALSFCLLSVGPFVEWVETSTYSNLDAAPRNVNREHIYVRLHAGVLILLTQSLKEGLFHSSRVSFRLMEIIPSLLFSAMKIFTSDVTGYTIASYEKEDSMRNAFLAMLGGMSVASASFELNKVNSMLFLLINGAAVLAASLKDISGETILLSRKVGKLEQLLVQLVLIVAGCFKKPELFLELGKDSGGGASTSSPKPDE
ncbi:hypothetical protein RND71_004167 [Anisodus tanguticus]|uniref:Uncharacterized protein n=1 Tax=Anisodus tanguticus TaxID=243964 RepID=A0AAE1T039_9SOLA|nr:hypothetical protein RND71_004167 [Anisodus tanguticus]